MEENPWEIMFDDDQGENVFDCGSDALINYWFLALVFSGKLEDSTFDYNGKQITLTHDGW